MDFLQIQLLEILTHIADDLIWSLSIYLLLHVLFAILLLPCSIFTVLAGLIWGFSQGLLISLVGALLSSLATFLLARFFSDGVLNNFINKLKRNSKTKKYLTKVEQLGWKAVIVLQTNPIVPASSSGYLFGFSNIKFVEYLFSTAVAIIPLQIILVCIGKFSRDILDKELVFLSLFSLSILLLIALNYKKILSLIGLKK